MSTNGTTTTEGWMFDFCNNRVVPCDDVGAESVSATVGTVQPV